VERDKPKKSESVGQTLQQLPWKQKRRDLKKIGILAAILKILKAKSITLSNDLFLCQVYKGSAVWSEFNIFCTLVTMETAAILNFVNPLTAATHYGGYSYKVS
jgi:hypothetical protein